jgi:hypothetical protein
MYSCKICNNKINKKYTKVNIALICYECQDIFLNDFMGLKSGVGVIHVGYKPPVNCPCGC